MKMQISFPGGKKVNAQYEQYLIETDQPKKFGGEETAPEPLSLFIASIGTCAGFYVLHFCKKRYLSTEHLEIILTTEDDEKTHMIKNIFINIILPSDFPEQYQNAVIRAANQCAVKKLLEIPPQISTTTSKKT
jgi:ribosomal protein S12 methylthiotransferase accessory factor